MKNYFWLSKRHPLAIFYNPDHCAKVATTYFSENELDSRLYNRYERVKDQRVWFNYNLPLSEKKCNNAILAPTCTLLTDVFYIKWDVCICEARMTCLQWGQNNFEVAFEFFPSSISRLKKKNSILPGLKSEKYCEIVGL